MKKILIALGLLLLATGAGYAAERMVLGEVFTNTS